MPNMRKCVMRMSEELYTYFKLRAAQSGLPVSSLMVAALQEYADQKGALKTLADMMQAYQGTQEMEDAQKAAREPRKVGISAGTPEANQKPAQGPQRPVSADEDIELLPAVSQRHRGAAAAQETHVFG